MSEIEITLDDADLEADSYGIAIDIPSNEMRVRFYDADGGVLSDFTTSAAGAYEFAHRILRSYDKLEGI